MLDAWQSTALCGVKPFSLYFRSRLIDQDADSLIPLSHILRPHSDSLPYLHFPKNLSNLSILPCPTFLYYFLHPPISPVQSLHPFPLYSVLIRTASASQGVGVSHKRLVSQEVLTKCSILPFPYPTFPSSLFPCSLITLDGRAGGRLSEQRYPSLQQWLSAGSTRQTIKQAESYSIISHQAYGRR